MLKYAFQIGPKRRNISATMEGNRVAAGIANTFWSASLSTVRVKFANTICQLYVGRHGLTLNFGILPANLTIRRGRFAELLLTTQAEAEGTEGEWEGSKEAARLAACDAWGWTGYTLVNLNQSHMPTLGWREVLLPPSQIRFC